MSNTTIKPIRLKNNLRQMLPLNLYNAEGTSVGVEIPAHAELPWPDCPLGPDAQVKIKKKYLTIIR